MSWNDSYYPRTERVTSRIARENKSPLSVTLADATRTSRCAMHDMMFSVSCPNCAHLLVTRVVRVR